MMEAAETIDLDFLQDDFIRAVLYPFAMADYEGVDSVSVNAVASSDVLVEASLDIVNEALGTAQRAGLIKQDEERIGAIRLTELGMAKFCLVRNDFFDDDEIEQLRGVLHDIEATEICQSPPYQAIKASCAGLGALPGQDSPCAGQWFSRARPDVVLNLKMGEEIPGPQFDGDGNQIIWYLKRCSESSLNHD
jgi:hypothetical protein